MLATVKLIPDFPITDYKNLCIWDSNDARNNAIDGWKPNEAVTLNNVSTIDIDKGVFRCQLDYVTTLNFNYMYFSQNGRRFYCFVRDIEWIQNTKMCVVHFEIDYFTTFQRDIDFKKCLVVREHVTNDSFGAHTVDEGFNVSEYITHDYDLIDYTNFYVGIALSDTSFISDDNGYGNYPPVIRKTPTGYINATILTSSDAETAEIIYEIVRMGKTDSIIGVYLQPRANVTTEPLFISTQSGEKFINGISRNIGTVEHDTRTVNRPSSFGNDYVGTYTPKNKKCFCYPFNYCEVTNQKGNSTSLKFELSNNHNAITLKTYCPIGYNTNSYTYPDHYNGVNKNLSVAVCGDTNPLIPYNTDSYAQYWGANYNSISNNFRNMKNDVTIAGVNGLLSAVGSSTSGGAISTLPSTALNLYNSYNQALNYEATLKDVENRPDITHDNFTGDAPLLELEFGFKVKVLQARPEYIEQIDNYFSMYGYKINLCKVPNLKARSIFTYIQTNGCNIVGSCPQIAIDTIKKAFDNGVTVWRGLGNMYNYDFDGNSI